ncbi:hypothetical protein NL676_034172 [Syzygium grande]|nr:hypothetical protein NL676_034172 [Syzygium grande]
MGTEKRSGWGQAAQGAVKTTVNGRQARGTHAEERGEAATTIGGEKKGTGTGGRKGRGGVTTTAMASQACSQGVKSSGCLGQSKGSQTLPLEQSRVTAAWGAGMQR